MDFLAAGGHKWLCGPAGTGVFYCRRERLGELPWGPLGWFGYEGAGYVSSGRPGFLAYDLPPRKAVKRFESGTYNLLGVTGLAAALEELAEVGIPAVATRVKELSERISKGMEALGHEPVCRDGTGIVSVRCKNPGGVAETLSDMGCLVSCADAKLRISAHYWTSDDEVEILLEALAALKEIAKFDLDDHSSDG